jgi:predicted dehydrogenase
MKPGEVAMNRRDFLKKTGVVAGAAAWPTILTSPVLGADGLPPASERVRLGFIGVRNRGLQNLSPMMKNAVAVCDVDRNVMAIAKDKVEKANGGTCLVYDDYRKMLENKDIDAVVISTPDHWHALQTIHACEAGKDVYCEKPLTLVVDEGKAMVAAARRYNRIVQTGSQQRSDNRFRTAAELVRNGKLGKIKTVTVGLPGPNFKGPAVADGQPPSELNYDMWLGPAPMKPYNELHVHYYFRFFWDYSGGQMTNFGAHDLDITQWALGMDESGPISAEGTATYPKSGWYETPERFDVTYTYANGVVVKAGQAYKGGVTFEGEKGTIHVNRSKLTVEPAELNEPLSGSDIRLYDSKDHYRNFLECVKTRKLPICDVAIGHRSATVCHIGNIAIRTGRKLTWDPEKEQVVGDAEQAKMTSYPYRKPWKLG